MRVSGGEYAWIVTAGPGAGVENAVDRRRRQRERPAGPDQLRRGLRREPEPVLADVTVEHADRRRGLVVIMEPRVLILAPADQPGVDVLVVPDLLVDANVVRMADEVAPALGLRGEPVDEPCQLLDLESSRRAPPPARRPPARARSPRRGDPTWRRPPAARSPAGPSRTASCLPHQRGDRLDRSRPVARGLVVRRVDRAGPPPARRGSRGARWIGAPPASIANTIRSDGCSRRPKHANVSHAACIWPT